MTTAIGILIVLVGATLVSTLVRRNQIISDDDPAHNWDTAVRTEIGPISSGLSKLAKPISQTSYVSELSTAAAFAPLRAKVVASGTYGQRFDVFLAHQFAAVLVGMAGLVLTITAELSGALRLGVALGAIGIAFYPYNRVVVAARKRADAAAAALPDFVELLQMPLASGMSVLEALRFTAKFDTSVVAAQVRWLVDTITGRSMDEAAAFREAGARIGTPEAQAFFTSLGQSHLEGMKVTASLAKQADSLRAQSFQRRRGHLKKLPTKLVVIFALHFLPMLFVLTMVPLLISLQSIG